MACADSSKDVNSVGNSNVALPPVPAELSCETDDQCEVYGFQGEDCCDQICETTTVTTKEYATQHRDWRNVHCTGDFRCPMARCAGPQPWDFNYKAVCLNKQCVREDTFKELPEQAALQFLCQLTEFSKDLNLMSVSEREQAIIKQTGEQAKDSGVDTWPTLAKQISRVPRDIRKKWLHAGVKAHQIESCSGISNL